MKILGIDISRLTGQKKQPGPRMRGSGRLSANDRRIISQIVGQFRDMSRKDIRKWRQAIQLAALPDKPRTHVYHDLVDDLMTDGHLQAQILLRKNATLNTEFLIRSRDGGINEEATRHFRSQWFYRVLDNALDATIRGGRVMELHGFTPSGDPELHAIPLRHTIIAKGWIQPDLTKEEYINYREEAHAAWVLEVGGEPLGIINNVTPNLIWKRNAMQAWAEFCERFGLPMVAAYTNRTDADTVNRIDAMLSQLAQAARGVFPEGSRIEFKEANRTDAYHVFDKYVERNNREMAEAIVGGTMLTDDGSSRSQSEVHERNLDEKLAAADKRAAEFLVNGRLIPMLLMHGRGLLKEGDALEFTKSHNLPLHEYWGIVSGIMQTHEVDPEWLAETFDVPILGKKKALAKAPNPKPGKEADAVALYGSGWNVPDYPEDKCCPAHPEAAGDGRFRRLLKQYHEDFLKDLWHNRDSLGSQARLTAHEALHHLKGLWKGWGRQRLTAAYDAPDHLALQMMESNVFEFTASKMEARLAAMSDLILDKDNLKIRSFDEFKAEAEKITTKFNEVWLETEYNLAVAVGQNAANYLRHLSEKDTVTSFVKYQTIGDSSVRPSHAALDGLIFSMDDKEAMTLWPPNGYNCRCEMVQHFRKDGEAVYRGQDAKKMLGVSFTGSQFDINRGDTRQVFTRKQFYHHNKGMAEKLDRMAFDTIYSLDKWDSFKGRLKDMKLDGTITGQNVARLFRADVAKNGVDYMGFKDHLNRSITLSRKTFGSHTKGKYLNPSELRHQLFPHLAEALKNPDEVWLHGHGKKGRDFQVRYLKFYKDRVLVVNAQINKDMMGLEINTWFNMRAEEDIRRGLLIHSRE